MCGDDYVGGGAYVLCDSNGILIGAAVLKVACGSRSGEVIVDCGYGYGGYGVYELYRDYVVSVNRHNVIFKRELARFRRK